MAGLAAQRVGVPVVSVGNLTLGGTGKTPMVKWIARWAGERGIRVAIVSRGYGAVQGEPNDEARELAQALPDVPHVQNPDRVAAARRAIDEFAAELIILDDGFQHRRLARDLDIVLLDALRAVWLRPRLSSRHAARAARRLGAGRRRLPESGRSGRRPAGRAAIRDRVAKLAPQAAWCEVVHAPSGLVNSRGQTQPLDVLRGRRVAAFCGLGNPAGFRRTLESTGCEIVVWREFPDHHAYLADRLRRIRTRRGKCCGRLRRLHAQGPGEDRARTTWRSTAVGGHGRTAIRGRRRIDGSAEERDIA